MEERQENRSRTMQELGDMFDREVAETDSGRYFDLANPGGMEENVKMCIRDRYYRDGRYDFLLNSTENIDLLNKRFIVFEIDSIKENRRCV